MVNVYNDAGECVYVASSDAEAARWFLESGRRGDHLDTGEYLSEVAITVLGVPEVSFYRDGTVVTIQ